MAIINCKNCGGKIELSSDKTYATCEYCGSIMTLPRVSDEQRLAAFNRGNHFRRIGEFDKALAVYEHIVQEDDTDAEAHWCCALCRFGIEYVEDPTTYEWIPTCHRASFDSFLDDVDYKAALDYSDGITQKQYMKEGAKIAEIQRSILATSQSTEPYDIFICYKESDENGERTRDSVLAQEIYYQLKEQGKRIFFSRITLEDMVGTQYEPYIFAALNSAKIMIVVGTKPEHFNAIWVKNEWSRFLAMMKKDRDKILLPCYRDMDPYDLPEQLSILQSYDMGKISFMADLTHGISKILDTNKQSAPSETVVVQQTSSNMTALLKRGHMALEDQDWAKADQFFEEVLNQDAECADAYLGKFLAQEKYKNIELFVDGRIIANYDADYDRENFIKEDYHHITSVIEKYSVENYLDADTIRTFYPSYDLSYPSSVNDRKSQYAFERERWNNHKILSRTIMFASEELKIQIEAAKNRLLNALKDQINQAQAEETKARQDAEAEYLSFLSTCDENVAKAYETALSQREKDYQEWKERSETATSVVVLQALSTHFSELGDYKESKQLAEYCLKRIDEIADEKARQQQIEDAKLKKAQKIVAIAGICAVAIAIILILVSQISKRQTYKKANALFTDGQYEKALEYYESLEDYKDCASKAKETSNAIAYAEAEELLASNQTAKAAIAFGKAGDFKDASNRSMELWKKIIKHKTFDSNYEFSVAVKSDGTVVATGNNDDGQCDVSAWRDIVAVAASSSHTVGLKSDGTVVATGSNSSGQCNVSAWEDIVAIYADGLITIGLKSNGTVIATGSNNSEECNVSEWTDIVAVSTGDAHTVGLKTDGTVVAVGLNEDGQCDISEWKNIVAIDSSGSFTVGLKSNGTVVATGSNYSGQCNVSAWTEIIAISADNSRTMGLKSNGTVVAAGHNSHGECNVSHFSDVISIHTSTGLKSNGTVVTTATYLVGSGSKNYDLSSWSDIVAIHVSTNHILGLKSDGTMVAAGNNEHGECNVSSWTDIKIPE